MQVATYAKFKNEDIKLPYLSVRVEIRPLMRYGNLEGPRKRVM